VDSDGAFVSREELGASREGRLEETCGVAEDVLANLLELNLKPHAWVAALAASGGWDLMVAGSFEDEVDLASLPGLNVLNMRPFFSGEGVRELFASAVVGVAKDDRLAAWASVCVDAAPELFRGASEGRLGRGGGRERSL
jgi:hypothetical protein